MDPIKKILKKLFLLPSWLTLLIAVPSFLFVFIMLRAETGDPLLSYLSYALSAYALIITVTKITSIVQEFRRGAKQLPLLLRLRAIPSVSRFLDDPVFRTQASLYGGLAINLLYAAINLASGIYYHSLWFTSLSAYYVFLSLIRFLLLHHVRRSPIGREYHSELRRCRLCGAMLLILNLSLSGIVTLVVVWNQGFEYGGYLIYIMAIYAFGATITSIVNMIRFRKYNSPILSAAKAINLTAALVSMLSLETAMLSQFDSSNNPIFRRTMTASTGFAVCVFVLGMALYMMLRTDKRSKRPQNSLLP